MTLPPFTSGQLEHLARLVGESTTGGEIDRLLAEARLPPSDISPKWRRIRDSFERVQARDGGGKAVAKFVKLALAPDRFFGAREAHEALCGSANEILSFAGLELRSDGKLVRVTAARTLGEAEQRADRLKAKLKARDVHPDVLAFWRAELVQENYFHAVLEAAKSVAQKIRDRTGLTGDAATLIDAAFTTKDNMPGVQPPRGSQRGLRASRSRDDAQGVLHDLPQPHRPRAEGALGSPRSRRAGHAGASLDVPPTTRRRHRDARRARLSSARCVTRTRPVATAADGRQDPQRAGDDVPLPFTR